MAVKDFQRNERVAARILTVDPAQRRVEGALKDGGMVQIRVWEIPTIFRWPATGEVWLIKRKGAYWELESRIENNEDTTGQIENVPEGVTQIHGTHVKMGDGRDVVVTDESLAHNGDAPIWNTAQKKWIPAAPSGGGGITPVACKVIRGTHFTVSNASDTAVPFEASVFENSPNPCWNIGQPTRLYSRADGLYIVEASWAWSSNPASGSYLLLTSDTFAPSHDVVSSTEWVSDFGKESALVYMPSGFYVELFVKQFSGGDMDMVGGIPGQGAQSIFGGAAMGLARVG